MKSSDIKNWRYELSYSEIVEGGKINYEDKI